MRYLFPDWLNLNRRRKYPLSDGADLSVPGGGFLADNVLLDALLYPLASPPIFFRAVNWTGETYSFRLSDGTGELFEGSTSFRASEVPVEVFDSQDRRVGVLLVDTIAIESLPAEVLTYEYAIGVAPFAARVHLCWPADHVSAIEVGGEYFTGEVYMVGGPGVLLETDGSSLIVNVVGDPLWEYSRPAREGGSLSGPPFLRSINGIPPSPLGDFRLEVGRSLASGNLLRIQKHESGLILSLGGADAAS